MRTYTIKAGKHYASGFPFRFGIHFGDTHLVQRVKLDESALYTPYDWENDYNKGCGFIYGFFNDKNSMRWGWRQDPLDIFKVELAIYVHKDGEEFVSTPISVYPAEYIIDLENIGNKIIMTVYDDNKVYGYTYLNMILKPKAGWKNYPYFGGNNPTRHKTTISTKTLA